MQAVHRLGQSIFQTDFETGGTPINEGYLIWGVAWNGILAPTNFETTFCPSLFSEMKLQTGVLSIALAQDTSEVGPQPYETS